MKKMKIVAAALAVAMAVGTMPNAASAHHYRHIKHVKHMKGGGHGHGGSSVPWIIIGCASGVVLAALAANYRDHRELTADEAWSCGALFLFSQPRYRP
jgi:hypothetical protein